MNKEMEDKMVPKLRFPEFDNEGAWLSTTIGEVGRFYYGKSAPKWSLAEDAPTLCVRYGELYTKFDTIITEVISRTNIDPSNLKFSKGGEILVPRVGEVPRDFAENVCYLPFPNIAIGEMISVYNTKEYPIFYAHYFRILWREFAKVVEGQNVKNLYYINLEPIVIGKPSYLEQRKIADCLSSLDDLISVESKRLDALKRYKKGLMQQLFPAEGEKAPKLRFSEFNDGDEWEERSFSDLLYSIIDFRGRTPIKLGMSWGGGNVISLSANNVKNGYINYNAECHLGSEELFEKWMGKVMLEKGDIVFTMEAPLGNALLIPDDQKYILSQRVVAFKTKEDVHNKFLIQLIWGAQFQNEIERLSTGSTAKGINQKRLNKLKVLFPKTVKEQQIIAEILESLDEEITAQTCKLGELKKHKKGLMQGLFPNIN